MEVNLKYIAFLRGINVSGQKLVKMEALRKAFDAEGYKDVKTYIQSGNIVFQSGITDTKKLASEIETLIENNFGFRTDVIIRQPGEIEILLNTLKNNNLLSIEGQKCYFTFLKEIYSQPVTLPLFSKNKDVEIIHADKMNFVSISHIYKGIYGFPNAFIEKLTRIPATTRNPETLAKILEL